MIQESRPGCIARRRRLCEGMPQARGRPRASRTVRDRRQGDLRRRPTRQSSLLRASLPVVVGSRIIGRNYRCRGGAACQRIRRVRARHGRSAEAPAHICVRVADSSPWGLAAATARERGYVCKMRIELLVAVRSMMPDEAAGSTHSGPQTICQQVAASFACHANYVLQTRPSDTPCHGSRALSWPISPDLPAFHKFNN